MIVNEAERLAALRHLNILHSGRNPEYDSVTELVAQYFDVPICAISLLDSNDQWFKSEVGLGCDGTPRDIAFCDNVVRTNDMFIVSDTRLDPRFSANPLVMGEPHIRFYAGCPIRISPDVPLGALCIIDRKPRHLGSNEQDRLRRFAGLVEQLLHLHQAKSVISLQLEEQKTLTCELAVHTQRLEQQKRLFDLSSHQAKLVAFDYDIATGECVLNDEAHNVMEIEEADGRSLQSLFRAVHFPDWYTKMLAKVDKEKLDYGVEFEIVTGKGNRKWLAEQGRVIAQDGYPPRRFGIAMDITESKLREQSFKLLFDNNPLPMWVYDYVTPRFLAVNDAALHQYGYTRERFLSMDLRDIRPVEEHDRLRARLSQPKQPDQHAEDWVHQRSDGTRLTVSIYSSEIIYDGRACKLVAAIDVTEQRRHEETITYLAHHDALTQLPNRRLFQTAIDDTLARNKKSGNASALMLIDVDNFKVINDSFGHDVGDQMIIGIADRLKSALGSQGALARLGGDEFAVFLDGAHDCNSIDVVAQQLLACVREPLQCNGHWITNSVSMGIALSPHDGSDRLALLRNADLALYRAKAEGRNTYRFFKAQMYLHLLERRELEYDLKHALAKQQFEVHYQPIVDLRTGEPAAYEALLRWNHPRRGRVSPAEFIPVAEETGFIEQISDWVIQQVCREAAHWSKPYKVAVNVSPVQFATGSVMSSVKNALELSGLAPYRLELEVTESLVLENSDKNITIMRELREMGVKLSLDDFGTGYSSLSRLMDLPVDKLKIDRSFVSGLGVSPRAMKIIKAAIKLGRGLKITTVAEGIETEAQAAILRRLGCHLGQGYLYGKPSALSDGKLRQRVA